MLSLPQVAATVVAIGTIGGSALTLDNMHVAKADFEQHLAYEQSRYVLELKKEIRELRRLLELKDDQYLEDALADLVDELCEIRPDDRECN